MALFIGFVVTFFAGVVGGFALHKHLAGLKADAKDKVLKIVK